VPPKREKLPSRLRNPRKATQRRSQEERSADTRKRLLDASIECLLESGYAGLRTTTVCERTGLSRGALLHHFPTKQDLVIEAVGHLVARMGAESLAEGAEVAAGTDPLDHMFNVIWANFRQPLFHAALEVWTASRTDPTLHASLYRSERTRGSGMARWYAALAGSAAKHPAFADVLQLTLHLMRGMALQRLIRPGDTERDRLYALWKQMAQAQLEHTPEPLD